MPAPPGRVAPPPDGRDGVPVAAGPCVPSPGVPSKRPGVGVLRTPCGLGAQPPI